MAGAQCLRLSESFFVVICISLCVSQFAVKIVDNCYALNFAKLLESSSLLCDLISNMFYVSFIRF